MLYVGITKRDPEIRFTEHQNSGTERASLTFRPIPGTGNLSYNEARIIEQISINTFKMQKNRGQLYNKINSISPKYWEKQGIK